MTRTLTILAAIVALAVSAAPVAGAGTAKKPPQPSYSISSGGNDRVTWNPGQGDDLNEAKAAAGGYGARASHATTQLQMFSGDAYVNEMG
jgi:hypothetical protein